MNEEKDNAITETPETEAVQQQETPVPADESMDEKIEINRLLDEGYSVKQIIDLGFKRRTVYHYAKMRVKPENE
ncbi:MAG: helix-turn-helix domain-containing protein, partial [Dehalococcoidales bacterium]|nr:helix-turn-helix domain-containing protein [Dehalococcoidales bacterium]